MALWLLILQLRLLLRSNHNSYYKKERSYIMTVYTINNPDFAAKHISCYAAPYVLKHYKGIEAAYGPQVAYGTGFRGYSLGVLSPAPDFAIKNKASMDSIQTEPDAKRRDYTESGFLSICHIGLEDLLRGYKLYHNNEEDAIVCYRLAIRPGFLNALDKLYKACKDIEICDPQTLKMHNGYLPPKVKAIVSFQKWRCGDYIAVAKVFKEKQAAG